MVKSEVVELCKSRGHELMRSVKPQVGASKTFLCLLLLFMATRNSFIKIFIAHEGIYIDALCLVNVLPFLTTLTFHCFSFQKFFHCDCCVGLGPSKYSRGLAKASLTE